MKKYFILFFSFIFLFAASDSRSQNQDHAISTLDHKIELSLVEIEKIKARKKEIRRATSTDVRAREEYSKLNDAEKYARTEMQKLKKERTSLLGKMNYETLTKGIDGNIVISSVFEYHSNTHKDVGKYYILYGKFDRFISSDTAIFYTDIIAAKLNSVEIPRIIVTDIDAGNTPEIDHVVLVGEVLDPNEFEIDGFHNTPHIFISYEKHIDCGDRNTCALSVDN